ncbi:MAG TPA: hypothetical protein GXZ43_03700 [Clostridiaceae bacterium]|nr:hypothetical protein [Clostridiaceae bacterium]
MGLRNVFNKKDKIEQPKDVPNLNRPMQNKFMLGIRYEFPKENSEDVFVFGRLKGTVTVGDAVTISHFGEDYAATQYSVIVAMRTADGQMPPTASNCDLTLLLQNAKNAQIKCGTVLFNGNVTTEGMHNAYLDALANVYIPHYNLNYKPEDAEKLSLTDCQEILRVYNVYSRPRQSQDPEIQRRNQEAETSFTNLFIRKLLSVKSIYCVYNKRTSEPHLFSRIVPQENEMYICTEPYIMLITKAFHERLAQISEDENLDIREINNENNKNLEEFLSSTFYLNGACGAIINFQEVVLKAGMLVTKPDFSEVPEINRPVMNPDLMRWILLIGQLSSVDTDDGRFVFGLYYNLLSQELTKALLITPVKYEGFVPEDETGKGIIKKGSEMQFPILQGKYNRPAIKMYTDWKRLYEEEGNEWSGLIQPVESMISIYDCVINMSSNGDKGIYISKEMFEEIKRKSSDS